MTPSSNRSNSRFHYAFVVTAVTGLVLLIVAGVRTAPSVLITEFQKEFNWSRAEISLAVSFSLIWFGLGGPVAGTLIERFGPRRVMVIGLMLISGGLGAMFFIRELWQLHLFWGVVVGVGTGILANVLGAVVANRWFRAHRGVVVGLMGAASAAGQLIFLPTMFQLNAADGWRFMLGAVAIGIAALLIPVALFMRDNPHDISVRPFGDDGTPATRAVADDSRRTSLAEAIRTRDFWLLAGSFFVCGYTTNGLVGTHLLPHAIEHGFDGTLTAGVISFMGLFNIIGTLGSGWLSDRMDNRWLLGCYYAFRALSLVFLPFVQNLNGLLIFSIVYGLDWIATVPPTINLTGQRFGRASVGVLYGWIFFSHMVGAAVAAYVGGAVHDVVGDYAIAFFSAAILGFIAAGFSLSIRRAQPAPVAG